MSIYNRYRKLCSHAVTNEVVFSTFRKHEFCLHMVEGVKKEVGDLIIKEIKKHSPYLLKHLDTFITSDAIGDPRAYKYDISDTLISPTTLRYIKILGDLINEFGSLDGLNIVEIGVGYGGQCKIIHDYCKPASYTLVDYHEVLTLSRKFLQPFNVQGLHTKGIRQVNGKPYDLCISNYAFAEMPRIYQNFYAQKVIPNSARGYMICNIFGNGTYSQPLSKEAIIGLKQNSRYWDENPQTGTDNIIYTWKQ